jgi:hypothetical protein
MALCLPIFRLTNGPPTPKYLNPKKYGLTRFNPGVDYAIISIVATLCRSAQPIPLSYRPGFVEPLTAVC